MGKLIRGVLLVTAGFIAASAVVWLAVEQVKSNLH